MNHPTKQKTLTWQELKEIHPLLESWLQKEFGSLKIHNVRVWEVSCEEPGCTHTETYLELEGKSKLKLRFPKKLSEITKLDFYLCVQKQRPLA
ncbi:MAG: hypothetical protein NZM25_10750 [Leptospiraceae bacterium]|nr:hypothetical protein [Leptospiraceae bacterium]MDW8305907.1 hypothetical protein [Leptospiraceae bacterium]